MYLTPFQPLTPTNSVPCGSRKLNYVKSKQITAPAANTMRAAANSSILARERVDHVHWTIPQCIRLPLTRRETFSRDATAMTAPLAQVTQLCNVKLENCTKPGTAFKMTDMYIKKIKL